MLADVLFAVLIAIALLGLIGSLVVVYAIVKAYRSFMREYRKAKTEREAREKAATDLRNNPDYQRAIGLINRYLGSKNSLN